MVRRPVLNYQNEPGERLGYAKKPNLFRYAPDRHEKHPWYGSILQPVDMPILYLIGPDWEMGPMFGPDHRETAVGFGNDEGHVLVAELLMNASMPWNEGDEYVLEGVCGFRGAGPGSAEIRLFLPGHLFYDKPVPWLLASARIVTIPRRRGRIVLAQRQRLSRTVERHRVRRRQTVSRREYPNARFALLVRAAIANCRAMKRRTERQAAARFSSPRRSARIAQRSAINAASTPRVARSFLAVQSISIVGPNFRGPGRRGMICTRFVELRILTSSPEPRG